MMESRAHEIVIQDVRRTIFLALLEYLYTDSIDIQMDSAMEVFEAADKVRSWEINIRRKLKPTLLGILHITMPFHCRSNCRGVLS